MASLDSDAQGPINLSLNKRTRGLESPAIFLRRTVYCYQNDGENKADFKWQWPWVIIVRFGRKFALVYSRRNPIEADIYDHRPPNRIFGVL